MPAGADFDMADGTFLDQFLVPLGHIGGLPVVAEACLHRIKGLPDRNKQHRVFSALNAFAEKVSLVTRLAAHDSGGSGCEVFEQLFGATGFGSHLKQFEGWARCQTWFSLRSLFMDFIMSPQKPRIQPAVFHIRFADFTNRFPHTVR